MRPYVIIVGCVRVCLEFLSWWNLVIERNERTSTEFNLVTAQSTAHEPPEDGRKYGPKHVGASFLKYIFKCFKY